jgi:hypothetical protein
MSDRYGEAKDRADAVAALLTADAHLSNREVARRASVGYAVPIGHRLVARIRRELEEAPPAPRAEPRRAPWEDRIAEAGAAVIALIQRERTVPVDIYLW